MGGGYDVPPRQAGRVLVLSIIVNSICTISINEGSSSYIVIRISPVMTTNIKTLVRSWWQFIYLTWHGRPRINICTPMVGRRRWWVTWKITSIRASISHGHFRADEQVMPTCDASARLIMIHSPVVDRLCWPVVVLKRVPIEVEILSQSRNLRENWNSSRS